MAKHYGIPYMGSKDKIAPWVLRNLPEGKRFVDLFGGGFAMSHAAMLSGRYEQILYNELNPLVCDLVKRACSGGFNYDRFKPEFITREMFFAEKENDGYVKYIWSFGNAGHSYLFGKDVEPIKKIGHDFVVFGKQSDLIPLPVKGNPMQRRIMLRRWAGEETKKMIARNPSLKNRKRQIEDKHELERLQQLQQLERLQQLQRLEVVCGSYVDYEHLDGDIVYCDPPYEGTSGYDVRENGFDSAAFYEWAYTRPYQVWFSSFKIGDDRFRLVAAKRKENLNGGAANRIYNFECIYTNK